MFVFVVSFGEMVYQKKEESGSREKEKRDTIPSSLLSALSLPFLSFFILFSAFLFLLPHQARKEK